MIASFIGGAIVFSNQTIESAVASAGTNHIVWTLQCVYKHHQGSQILSGNAERDIEMVIVASGVVSPCCCVCFGLVGGMFWNLMITASSAMNMKIITKVNQQIQKIKESFVFENFNEL